MFIILSGSSGVGKNTVIKEMQKHNDNLILMPTFTTREKREGEVEGLPYFYITKEDFQDRIKLNEFIEHEFIHNNFYGSSYKVFDEYIQMGKLLIKDIGVEGAQNLCIKLKDRTEIVRIFLAVKHKKELKIRLDGRGEKQSKLRLKRYGYEQKQRNKFDFIIFNKELEKTSNLINDLINLKQEDYYFKKDVNKLNKYKVKYYMNKLTSGKVLKPIKIAIEDGKAYVVDGEEKFVAGILTKRLVAKMIVSKKFDKSKYIFQMK